jgi:alkylhydroperoxidase/carboxymuconolactone decarboxylase family protein YurZ
MESQLELNRERKELADKLKQALPAVMAAESAVGAAVYKDGALSTKVKRLIALGIALRGCVTNCILNQTMRSLEAGATRDEIMETLSVAVGMSGTTGVAESLRVVKLLDELGKL